MSNINYLVDKKVKIISSNGIDELIVKLEGEKYKLHTSHDAPLLLEKVKEDDNDE